MSATSDVQAAFAPVLAALGTMQSATDRAQKQEAHHYLESFQKSAEAWTATFAILQSDDSATEAKMFAATTLKGKIVYDFHQLPTEAQPQLRDSVVALLAKYSKGPKPIRIQLSVALANIALQFLAWKDVLSFVVTRLGSDSDSIACLLDFLHVLPEEVNEGRKINLSEDDLSSRSAELLGDNGKQVLTLLIQYAQSSDNATRNPQLMECITSWMREIPLDEIIASPLMQTVMSALSSEQCFEAASDCLSAMIRETRDVDECLASINTLFPLILSLKPRIVPSADDADILRGLTRIFADAGEAWVVLIARQPENFRPLVECVLECCARDQERDAVSLTFNFWYELKQLLTLERYMQSRLQFVDVYSRLVDIMAVHLEFPHAEDENSADLFDGDREQEEKFRRFRHEMGDVLKDCCEVIGVTECLQKAYNMIQAWSAQYGARAAQGSIPHWQKLEAALFSMRAMGRMVPDDESIMLPQLIPMIVQIPDHTKVRFQAVMTLGRYTEWTAKHPETLEAQLKFITGAFQHVSPEVQTAAALSLRFFCNDCAILLKSHVEHLQQFYESVILRLPPESQEEITEGVASVLAQVDAENIYSSFKVSCDPIVRRVMELARPGLDDAAKGVLAEHLALIAIFITQIRPYVPAGQPNPAVQYCQDIFPVLAAVAETFADDALILERVCGCWRHMVLSYRTSITPMLPQLAEKLVTGFAASKQGCYLWASTSIVREFIASAPNVDQQTLQAIFAFFEQQATNFLRVLSGVAPEELPGVIEDFFRLCSEVLQHHSRAFMACPLLPALLSAACTSLTLLKHEPVLAVLHFSRDFLAYGTPDAPFSQYDDATGKPAENPPEVQQAVRAQLDIVGEEMTQRIMTGLLYTFPADCFPDASGALLALFQLDAVKAARWVESMLKLLPPDCMTPQEQERLLRNIDQRVQTKEPRKIRTLLQDFTNSYRRRNVAPRDGLGRLDAGRFKYSG